MKKDDIKIVEYVCKERECEECGRPATHCLTFLYENARSNPASSGYGGDDISWASDEEKFACDEHVESMRRNPPRGMMWCSDFYRYKDDGTETPHRHRYFYWEKVKEEIVSRQGGRDVKN